VRGGLPRVEKRFDEQSAGRAQDRDQEENAHPRAGDGHLLLTEIDLQLLAGRALDRTLATAAARRAHRISVTARSMVRTLTSTP
jgi:hypothetical protein